MELTPELKRRFCKNCNIPISIFVEPFFTDRIKLFSMYYNTIEELQKFVESIEPYDCEQDYYEHYNKTKDTAISLSKVQKDMKIQQHGYERNFKSYLRNSHSFV